MERLSIVNPTIQWFKYEVDLVHSNSAIMLHGQIHGEKLQTVSLCIDKVACKIYTNTV